MLNTDHCPRRGPSDALAPANHSAGHGCRWGGREADAPPPVLSCGRPPGCPPNELVLFGVRALCCGRPLCPPLPPPGWVRQERRFFWCAAKIRSGVRTAANRGRGVWQRSFVFLPLVLGVFCDDVLRRGLSLGGGKNALYELRPSRAFCRTLFQQCVRGARRAFYMKPESKGTNRQLTDQPKVELLRQIRSNS